MFDERTRGTVIIFASRRIPGQLIKNAVRDGDYVVLHKNGESVLVRNIQVIGNSRFKGIIYGFEPSHALEHQGLELDHEVEFGEQHIISCSEE